MKTAQRGYCPHDCDRGWLKPEYERKCPYHDPHEIAAKARIPDELLDGRKPRLERWEYADYIKSPQWERKRRHILERCDRACQGCGQSGIGISLDVHHLNYDRLGAEEVGDLIALCRACHKIAHEEGIVLDPFKGPNQIYDRRGMRVPR